jgi:sugar phosphate isomerase/epimerase
VSQDIERVVTFAKEFLLEGIEVRSLFGRAFKDLTRDDVRAIGSRFGRAGLKIAGCASPVFKCPLDDPSEIRRHKDLFKRSVEHAVTWNCDLVRVFTFFRRSTPSPEDDLKRASDHFPELLDAVKGTPVRIGVENEHTTIVGTGAELSGFLSLFDPTPILGGVWDPCNVVFCKGSGDPIQEDYPLVAERVLHVHVKDAKRVNGQPPEHCSELGKGEVNFPALFAELRRRGYAGWVSLETHWRTAALSAEAQHLPGGQGFSANAEPASRICMTTLRKMLEDDSPSARDG